MYFAYNKVINYIYLETIMKRKSTLFLVIFSIIISTSSISAFSFIESINNYGIDASGYNYVSSVEFTDGFINWGHTETWGHTLSPNFMSVPDEFTVANAQLEITGYQFLGIGGEVVNVGGTLQWSGITGWHWVNYTEMAFDITSIDHSFWNSSPLYVSMTPILDLGVCLQTSTLYVDYDVSNGSSGDPNSSVPEPASLLLFSLGLIGGRTFFRKKK